MQIDTDILFTWGAVAKKYHKNDLIFGEGETAQSYYQIYEGSVKMYYTCEDGKEVTLGIFNEGDSFGEPPLFNEETYQGTAIARCDAVVIKLCKFNFFAMLREYPLISNAFLTLFANRIYSRITSAKHLVSQRPEHRIRSFLETYKKDQNASDKKLLIPYTRQEIADFTHLRVETVIRTLTAMHRKNSLEIYNHKIYF